MQEYLILISIGPVQDYIASARKLRDLWFGSHLLSELSKVVAKSLKDQGAELIFPAITDSADLEKESKLIVANKILAKTDKNPTEIIKEAKNSWKKMQIDFALKALEQIKKIKQIKINEELYKKQIGDSGEFFAAWVTSSDSYHDSKDKLEKLLAGRKNLREFNESSWDGAGLLKSSLDGARETVFMGRPKEIKGLLKKSEYLDTLGCVKRFYPLASANSKKHFDDLSDIALIPYLNKISKNKDLVKLLDDYSEHLLLANFVVRSKESKRDSKIKLDILSDMLFATEKEFEKADNKKDIWRSLQKLTNKNYAGPPPKYAAILVGDGDKMGVALDKITTISGHQTFSAMLSEFSIEVEKVAEDSEGSLIYAGGDDVMAYLPLHTAIKAADEMKKLFYRKMKDIFVKLQLPAEDIPTFSIGLAIVHHSAPLDKALSLARKAESVAKVKAERNALAIIQSKRSGHDITIFGKWDGGSGQPGLVTRISEMVKLYNDESKSLPHTLGYQLRQAGKESGDKLEFSYENGKLIPKNATAVTVMRIFEQKKKSYALKILLNGRNSVKRLSDELIVARQIAEIKKMVDFEEAQ